MNDDIIKWLLEGPKWVKYASELQLLDLNPNLDDVLTDNQISLIIDRLTNEQNGILALKNKNVSYLGTTYWDLFFLADIGLTFTQLNLHNQAEEIFSLQLPDGIFDLNNQYRLSSFCIATILLSSLVKMGYKDDLRIDKFINVILESQRLDGGWHCAKKRAKGHVLQNTESCPMDNLNILMLLGQYEKYRNNANLNGAIDLLLKHWDKRAEKNRPYGFGIGTQFMKLKYPETKYGILRVLDTLSLFPYALNSNSFKSMLSFVQSKAVDGKYTPESITKAFNNLDFGQKKAASPWITFLIKRIEKRFEYK